MVINNLINNQSIKLFYVIPFEITLKHSKKVPVMVTNKDL